MLVDKPAGMTSHDVVQQVRRRLGTRSVGHTGTLDPFATGLLVVLIGRATRLARFIAALPKTYLATARLGIRTTTDDPTGQVIETRPVSVSETRVREELARFSGTQLQRPPGYSAKHVAGERSYRRARRGEPIELPEVSVIVHRIELVGWQPPELDFRAVVGTGTYIRAIGRDLGERLGVGSHLIRLRREAVGRIRVEDAVPLDQVSRSAILPAHRVLGHLPQLDLDEAGRRNVLHGRPVADRGEAGKRAAGQAVALLEGGELLAVATAEDGWLRPKVVLAEPS